MDSKWARAHFRNVQTAEAENQSHRLAQNERKRV